MSSRTAPGIYQEAVKTKTQTDGQANTQEQRKNEKKKAEGNSTNLSDTSSINSLQTISVVLLLKKE